MTFERGSEATRFPFSLEFARSRDDAKIIKEICSRRGAEDAERGGYAAAAA